MNPLDNVCLGGTVGLIAICMGLIKLSSPGSPWHRRIGRGTGILALGLLLTMIHRAADFQVPFGTEIWIHMVLGGLGSLLFLVKFLVAWKKIPFSQWLRPLGYMLFFLLPLTAIGKIVPFVQASMNWQPLTPEEILRDPVPTAFDRDCLRCHSRETATDGVGRRKPERWIKIVQPMAWAGGLTRENCRGALASLLVKEPPKIASDPMPVVATGTVEPADPTARHCIACHNQKRIFRKKRSLEEWRKITARMQTHSRESIDMKPLTDAALKEVVEFLTKRNKP